MRQSRLNPSGFAANTYGVALVLAGSSADFTTGNGYAVVFGNNNSPDSVKLVRYTGGLTGPSNLHTLVAMGIGTSMYAQPAASTVRVLYDPEEENWMLELGPSTTDFTDPLTTTYTRVGTKKDADYTNTTLLFLGCFWNHATTASEYAIFDNIYVTAPCALGIEPTQGPSTPAATNLTSTSATLTWAAGNGARRLVVARPASTAATAPLMAQPIIAILAMAAGL
jgi:hypothetical protein